MSLQFKEATEKEIPVISALADRIWRKHYEGINSPEQIDFMMEKMYAPESLLQQMKEQQQFTIVLENNTPIGYMSVSTKDHKHYFLHKIYIEATEQRKGTGAQALKYLIHSYKNMETIELTVNRQNYKAVNFYFKSGFVIKGVEDFDIGRGYLMPDFIMVATIERLKAAMQ